MATELDYAALSAFVYNNVRKGDNILTTLPPGWELLPVSPNGIVSGITGFTAAAYRSTTTGEIVIAYKGTDTVNVVQTAQDFLFGNAAAIGGSTQLVQAALFYEQVKAQYGGNITFTGHSLGGGLASVMGVWFGKSATTFAQAPFELAAANPAAIAAVEAALALNLYADSDFLLFNPLDYAARQANITNYFVHGEVLSQVLAWLPNVVGTNNPIIVGGEQNVSAGDLHSMILHATLIMQPALRLDSYALPNLMAEIFDRALYFRDPNTPNRDFLSSLLNDQVRVGYTNADGLLARFAGDIDKLTQYGTNLKDGALGKALIDTAIADYYFMQNGFTKDFFNTITGGITFDLADIGTNWSSNKTTIQLANTITQQYNLDLQTRLFLKQDNAWTIQSGANALNAVGTGTNNDAMIGGTTDDTLNGGDGNDFLLGGDGADTLNGGVGNDLLVGGAGADTLDGGAGYDTYTLEGSDTIRDSDGKGIIKDKAGNFISGAIQKNADGSYTYLNDPSVNVTLDANLSLTLTLADGTVAVVENFTSGNLGLQLSDAATQASTTTLTGDIIPTDIDPAKAGIQAAADANGNPVGQAGAYADILGGTAGNDHIMSGELGDDVGSGAGDDWIEGGAGDDYLHGGTDNDLVEGGAGSDIVAGEDGDDQLYGNTRTDTATAIANGNSDAASNLKGDWLAGGAGDDTLIAGADNDVLSGGAGSDLIIAGAGDDYILGDADYVPQYIPEADPRYQIGSTSWFHSSAETFNWSVTPQADGGALFQPVVEYAPGNSPAAGNDIIYAGDGADYVWAGSGADVVYGEGGADKINGDAGNDILFGGAGDDTLNSGGPGSALYGGAACAVFYARKKLAANDAEGRLVA